MKTGDYKKIAKKHGCRLGKIKRLWECCREIRLVACASNIEEGKVYDGTYWNKWNPYTKEELGHTKEMVIVIKAEEGTKYQDSIVQELISLENEN